ncbi:MAG: cytochrome c3 family protein [Coriobacteriales bacterium]|nr:cytochrome c3 family protein [Coriobacteriales bacterium]
MLAKQGFRANTRLLVTIFCLMVFVLLFAAMVACAPRDTDDASVADVGVADASVADAGEQASATQAVSWAPDADCAGCHINQANTSTDLDCAYSRHLTVDCITCHTNAEGALAKAHANIANAKQPTKLKRTSVSQTVCMSCHDASELVELTAQSGVLTDKNGKVVNPHDIPALPDHQQNVDCVSCHKMHQNTPREEIARGVCTGCHHEDIYECGTCHK